MGGVFRQPAQLRGASQQPWELVAPPWHQHLSSPLSCLGHQKGTDGGDADGGWGDSGTCSHFIQMAEAEAEAVPRPEASMAVTWHTSTWHTWEGQPTPGQDSFSGLSCLQIMWYVYGKPVLKKSERYDRLALEG